MIERFIHLATGLVLMVEPDETGWYIASVPVLPGCVAQGEKLEDALRDLTAAIEDVLEVIRQDDPDRFKQLTSLSLSERRLGVISRAATPDPVFEHESLSEPGLTWRAA